MKSAQQNHQKELDGLMQKLNELREASDKAKKVLQPRQIGKLAYYLTGLCLIGRVRPDEVN